MALIIAKGSPCKILLNNETLLGRILERLALQTVNFSTPHGTKYEKIRISLLTEISHVEFEELRSLEIDAKNLNSFYCGQLEQVFTK